MTNKISCVTLNVKGLGDKTKKLRLFRYLKRFHRGFVFLQDTHSSIICERGWIVEWGSEILFSHGTTSSRGVALLTQPQNYPFDIKVISCDPEGRFLFAELKIDNTIFILGKFYAPTADKIMLQKIFLEVISKEIFSNLDNLMDSSLNIFGGDRNTHLDPLKDKFPVTYKIKCNMLRICWI